MPQAFGGIQGDERYLHGLLLPKESESNLVEWRDELFQRVDGRSLKIMAGAQRHARPKAR
jgi:hypothetical protein